MSRVQGDYIRDAKPKVATKTMAKQNTIAEILTPALDSAYFRLQA